MREDVWIKKRGDIKTLCRRASFNVLFYNSLNFFEDGVHPGGGGEDADAAVEMMLLSVLAAGIPKVYGHPRAFQLTAVLDYALDAYRQDYCGEAV